ncbi:hypothetical protein [Thalassotalea ganghwensis]
MYYLKIFGFIFLISIVGYLLILDAGMSSDQASSMTLYQKIELGLGCILWWPASLYLGLKSLLGYDDKMLGIELWIFQIAGNFALISYLVQRKHNKQINQD